MKASSRTTVQRHEIETHRPADRYTPRHADMNQHIGRYADKHADRLTVGSIVEHALIQSEKKTIITKQTDTGNVPGQIDG